MFERFLFAYDGSEHSKRAAKVEITIDNTKMNLRPGMFAQVKIPVEVNDNAILVPSSAVMQNNQEATGDVVVVENGIIKRKQVQLGLAKEDVIEITNGLIEGELVVNVGQQSLKDGEKVTVVNR